MKILIVRLGSLGDLVHALPVAAALRGRFPDAQIDWLVDAHYAALLDLVPVIDRRVIVSTHRRAPGARDDRRPADREGEDAPRRVERPGWRGLMSAVSGLRAQRYDAAVDLQGLIKSAVLARLSGARRVIGFERRYLREPAAWWWYSEGVNPGGAAHVVDKNLSVLGAFGIAGAERAFPIDVPGSEAARSVAEASGGAGYVLVNAGAAWPNKRWPIDRFGDVAAWLRRERGLRPVVLWGPGEEDLADCIVAASDGAAVVAPPTGIGDLLALSRGARLVLSGDTGPLHLAAAAGAPIVALFGPTDPARNGPWESADICLSRFGDCVCHYQRRCGRSRPCIEEISVEDVRGAIDRRLAAADHA